MEISSTANVITISGNIKTVSDFQSIKTKVDEVLQKHKNIVITIVDSLSITSSVIGYLNKLVLKDAITIEMNIGNERLMELIDDLNLTSVFKVKKI
jgi:hypothetical protein